MFKESLAVFAVLFAVGCGSDATVSKEPICAPGKTEACACVGGLTQGVQSCNAEGSGWNVCECPGDHPSGSAGGTGKPEPQCSPGSSERCLCGHCDGVFAQHVCDAEGNWGACGSDECTQYLKDVPSCQ